MSGYICRSCKASFRQAGRVDLLTKYSIHTTSTLRDTPASIQLIESAPQFRSFSQATRKRTEVEAIESFLSKPSWSVSSLLPSAPPEPDLISDAQFDHLLRLSAIDIPWERHDEIRSEMKQSLLNHLHFVQDIQKVNTDDVEPLVAVRNETEEGLKDITIGMKEVEGALVKEEIVGHMKRSRRNRDVAVSVEHKKWNPLATTREYVERAGEKYFFVCSGKERPTDEEAALSAVKISRQLTIDRTSFSLCRRRKRFRKDKLTFRKVLGESTLGRKIKGVQ